MTIAEIDQSMVWQIQKITYKTWIPTYEPILPDEQIYYMLDMMYSKASLVQQMNDGHQFYVLKDNIHAGFISTSVDRDSPMSVKIQKLYVLPEKQGLGYGKALIDYVATIALDKGYLSLTLNVNRYNNAQKFYNKIGFEIIKEEDIDIGHGYLMEDYKMKKDLKI